VGSGYPRKTQGETRTASVGAFMKRMRVGTLPKTFKRRDIEFNFSDVQRKNPKTESKTPLYLYTDTSIPRRHRAGVKWWETNGE
jgi:hypothetical protein